MAHLATLGALTEELVTLLTSTTAQSDPGRFNIYRETALRSLRYGNYPRTNQFDVSSRLDGLGEKFRVYNEDPLADALEERIALLTKLDPKWTPEILHLLLELSDSPVKNSRLEDLDFLKEPDPDTGPALKWKDLVAEDPLLREKKIWKNVNFAAGSSDEEEEFEDNHSELSGATESTIESSVDNDFSTRPEGYTVNSTDENGLNRLQKTQFWQKKPNVDGIRLETVKKPITELQAVREVLFMCGGKPTSLFEMRNEKGLTISPSKGYALKHASADAYFKLATSFAADGAAVWTLRIWTERSQESPMLQVLQSAIQDHLTKLDSFLTAIQKRFVAPDGDVVISLLRLQDELKSFLQPLVIVTGIVKRLTSERYSHAFRYLEMFFDETCTSQMAGNDAVYSFMGDIFFRCFQIYLRPIRTWMEEGELTKGDKIFFVSGDSAEVEPALLWRSRYKIRKTHDGILHAPRFLTAAANKIFTTGKSVVVLKQLNRFEALRASRDILEPTLDFETVCNPKVLGLAPFSELFDTAFGAWVESKHQHASMLLRKTLFDSCGLHTALDALSHIYFMSDGIMASAMTNSIFDKLDTLNMSWNDRFTLTELAQSTIGSVPCIATDRLRMVVRVLPMKYRDVTKCRKTVKILRILDLKYNLSWPIQIILTPPTISSYQRIFSFLLEIRRSSHILTRNRLVNNEFSSTNSTDEQALYYSLRTRLLWFTQTIYYYLTALVLDPCSKRMKVELEAARDVDAMIQVHSAFIKTTIDRALLGSKVELIQKSIVKLLDLGIKLEDAQAAHALASKEALQEQQEMMDLSMASLGLQTPRRGGKYSHSRRKQDLDSSSEEEEDLDVDLSILSSFDDVKDDSSSYLENLRNLRGDFDRLTRFVASGLRGVARAGGGEEAKSWDILAEMLETGLMPGINAYR